LRDGRSDLIAISPSLLAEAERALPDLRRDATRGATAQEIMRVLSQRFAVFPQPDRTDAEWAAWWSDYTNALDDISPDAIEAGMAEYVRAPDSEFFPKPGKLRELAQRVPNRMARAVQAAERALRYARDVAAYEQIPGGIEPEKPEPTETDKAAVLAALASFKREMAAKAPAPKPAPPPTSGPIDGSGLTALMRDHMRMAAE
jgi:hypothetical protein